MQVLDYTAFKNTKLENLLQSCPFLIFCLIFEENLNSFLKGMTRHNNLRILMLLALLLTSLNIYAGEDNIRFAYDVDFEMKFDNREYFHSAFTPSMTIYGARLTPAVGLDIYQNEKMSHRLMAGIDIMKDFGSSPISTLLTGGEETPETSLKQNNAGLFRELTVYYNLNASAGNTDLQLYAGIFPRRALSGEYSEAFISDSLKFYDNNLEGILLKIRNSKNYWELGCDRMGNYGQVRKERFVIFSYGQNTITPFFKVGYTGYMYHFAESKKAKGVVDNFLLNPFMKFEFAGFWGLDEVSVRLGWLQAMQNDRKFVDHYVFPGGGELDLAIKKWNVVLRNRLYCGTDIMPYYNNVDLGGDKYGNRLYFGDLFYRVHDDGSTGVGVYDRIELCYEPYVGKYLKIRLEARFCFHGASYSGCQQIISLRFNLNK